MPTYGSGPYGQGTYGQGSGGSSIPGQLTNLTGLQMFGWLPEMWYGRSLSTQALMEAEGEGLEQAASDVALIRDARLPETAPDWGIARLEDESALVPHPELVLDDRRARVIGHFRGIGSTIARLKIIAAAWGYGAVQIVPDAESFTLYVTFVDVRGVPAAIGDHQAEFRANVEAHLDIQWAFRYLTHGELKLSGKTHAQIAATGLTHTQLKTWNPNA